MAEVRAAKATSKKNEKRVGEDAKPSLHLFQVQQRFLKTEYYVMNYEVIGSPSSF